MCTICDLRMEFGAGHPMSLSVAVATRRAVEAGLVPAAPAWDRGDAIRLMHGVQRRLEWSVSLEAFASLPAFFVLLVETRTWAYFHPGPGGFDSSVQRLPPDAFGLAMDPVIVAAETALAPMLDGRIPFESCAKAGMLHFDVPETVHSALRSAWMQAWPATFSRFVCA